MDLGLVHNIAALCLTIPALLFFPASFALQPANDSLALVYHTCIRNAASVTPAFTHNLDTALQNLTALSSTGSNYGTFAAGSGTGLVYAMFQCRGDQSPPMCWACMQNATVRLPKQDCPLYVGARIQLDGCYLRYDTEYFYTLDSSMVVQNCTAVYEGSPNSVTAAANQALLTVVTDLAAKRGGFATGDQYGEYVLAQCLGYLNETQCHDCLSSNPLSSVCNASTVGGQVHMSSCYYRFDVYHFWVGSPSGTSAAASAGSPRPSALPPTKGPGSKTLEAPIFAAIGVLAGAALLCALLAWRYKVAKRVVNKAASWPQQLLQTKAHVFSFQELEKATGNFNPTNKLGAGGFGVVYKGILPSGEQIAVKKLSIGKPEEEGKEEFLNEVTLITSVQHKNLIRLLGCCVEGPERILVYDYLPNKSLDLSLFGDNVTLDWPTRYGIILGTAKGLAYLHEESHVRIIHRDIKPGNILLDDQLNPVIADFGVAKLVEENANNVNTRVAGTVGYVAPEYVFYGEFSEKVDVFSFGLVSLEVFTGKKNQHSSLLTWAWENYTEGNALDLVDEKLGDAFSPEEAMRVVHVSLLCTQEAPRQRPAMSLVTRWLSGTSAILKIPTRPTFIRYNDDMEWIGDSNHTLRSAPTSSQSMLSGGQVSRISRKVESFSDIGPR